MIEFEKVQENLNASFLEAIIEEEPIEAIKAYINMGANVNAKNYYDETALMLAQTAEQTKLLIEFGADVNAKDKDGKTTLELAETEELKAFIKAAILKKNIERCKAQIEKSYQIRKGLEKRYPEEKVSGAGLADEIARDVISGKEKRTITPEVGAEIRRWKAFEK